MSERVEITPDRLIVHVEGADRLWALKSRLEVPIDHVTGAASATVGPRAEAGSHGASPVRRRPDPCGGAEGWSIQATARALDQLGACGRQACRLKGG